MVEYAKKNYGVTIDIGEAKALKDFWIASFPEMTEHLNPPIDEITTRMNMEYFCKKHFNDPTYVREIHDLEQALTHEGMEYDEIREILYEIKRYMAHTISGRTKRNCLYTAACNYPWS